MGKKVNFYFGNGNYEDVLTCLATTKVNSYQTSSLPLAQFWNPEKKELQGFYKKCAAKGLDIANGDRYFEYPTPCLDKEKHKIPDSRPSMTDLMIINDNYKIAIEAKYTEYSESRYETINDWLKKSDNKEHKEAIKKKWLDYIRECEATTKDEISDDLPYQFLHRTASACYECNNKTPVLVYQLFYDSSNVKKKDSFINDLRNWANQLGLNDKIFFYIVEIEIKHIEKVKEKYNGIRSELFLIMKELKNIYEFDWDNIHIHKYDSNTGELILDK